MTQLLVGVLFTFLIQLTLGQRLHEQIYSSIDGAACFRILNATHQAGCTSSDKGNIGVVQMIRSQTDVEWLVNNGTAGPYMAVVSAELFHDAIAPLMAAPEKVAGVLLYENSSVSVSEFSQESRCPNEYSSAPGSQCSSTQKGGIVWNEKGTGLIRSDIPFPIFYLPKGKIEQIEKISDCYERYNLDKENQKGQPLCSLQLHSFMFAAVNSEVCMRRSATSAFLTPTKVCEPLGDYNVINTLFPREQDKDSSKKPVTLVTARLDTASLFDGVSPGAASSVVGVVSLISAASLLSKMIPDTDAALYDHNIIWTVLNGEAFDYIGSQRVAYDLSRGEWPSVPLNVDQIKLHVEIGQLGGALKNDTENWPLYAFVPQTSEVPSAVTEFMVMMSRNLKANITLSPEITPNLPPSSIHSFRRILTNVTESGDLAEVLLADYKETFTNKFYHSVLDDSQRIGYVFRNMSIDENGTFITTEALITNGTMKEADLQVKIARFVTALSMTLYQRVVGTPYAGNLTASAHMVDELLNCYLETQGCRLLSAAEYGEGGTAGGPAAPLYVGVTSWPLPPAIFTGHLLALLAGDSVQVGKQECQDKKDAGYTYYWLNGFNNSGVCIQTTMNFTQAMSPAFLIQDYDMQSGLYSTWTESVWLRMWARVFVSAGGRGAGAAAGTGALATVLAAVLTTYLKHHRSRLFGTQETAVPAGIARNVNC